MRLEPFRTNCAFYQFGSQRCDRKPFWMPCRRPAQFGTKLEQSEVVGVPGLQRAHQEFKLGKHPQTLETRVFQEKWPARESGGQGPARITLEPGRKNLLRLRE